MQNAIDRLIYKIKEMDNPTVMGLDPTYDKLPSCIKDKYNKNLKGICEAIFEFNKELILAIKDIIPAVKINIAFYEMYGLEGMKLFEDTCKFAKENGLIVIVDAKRGDIGTTAKAYSNAFLGRTEIGDIKEKIYDVDFLTVNPYMGIDSVKPFIDDCKEYGKGIFVLIKTSNPSSGELQNLKIEGGKNIYTHVAELVEKWGEDLRGKYGYSSVSAVVGATYKDELKNIRSVAKHTYFLIPGYGAQGGKAEDIALAFDENGLGGIVNASRSLMCAYKSDLWKDKFEEKDFAKATREEAIRMRNDLNNAIKNK